jgi:hypothetical protein
MATDPSFFTTPTGIAVIAAGGSFVAGLVGASISAWTVRRSHKERLAADEKLAERKFEFDNSLAERKFQLDARSADRKRRQDLAEEVLAGFQEVEAAVRSIRAPMSYSEEAKDRPRADGETEGAAKLRDVYYVSLARFDGNRAVISALLSRRCRMNAWFGADADAAFQKLNEHGNIIFPALSQMGRGRRQNPPKQSRPLAEDGGRYLVGGRRS